MLGVNCLEITEFGTSLIFSGSESLQLQGSVKNGKKEGGSKGKGPRASTAAPHASFPSTARHKLRTCGQGWKLPLLFFPSVTFGGTCRCLRQGPSLEAAVDHSDLPCAQRSLLLGSASLAGMLRDSQGCGSSWFSCRKPQESPNWQSLGFHFSLHNLT